jgi:hypothetical protein
MGSPGIGGQQVFSLINPYPFINSYPLINLYPLIDLYQVIGENTLASHPDGFLHFLLFGPQSSTNLCFSLLDNYAIINYRHRPEEKPKKLRNVSEKSHIFVHI